MVIETSDHRLDFGGLDLTGVEDYDGVHFYAMADGATLGNPQPVEREVVSSLLDGSFVKTESHGNREPSFQVWIEAPDSVALAYGEKLLFEQCSRQVEFGWTPPDGWGARTVFQAFTSSLAHQFDDLLELKLIRSYVLRLVCHPFGFSEDDVIDVAVEPAPAVPSTVTLASGASATDWTSPAGTVTSDGTWLRVPATAPVGSYEYLGTTVYSYYDQTTLTMSPVDFSATRYISATVVVRDITKQSTTTSPAYQFPAFVDGVQLAVASVVNLGSGMARLTWVCDDVSATTLRIECAYTTNTTVGTFGFKVKDVQRSNELAGTAGSTGRQSMRLAEVTGSARTAASVVVEHETAGLDEVLFYTSPTLGTGYAPNMRPWLVGGSSGTTTADTATVSGSRTMTTARYDAPTSAMPSGPYLLMGRFRSTPGAVSVAAATSTIVGSTAYDAVTLPTFAAPSGSWVVGVLGVVTLPGVKVATDVGTCRIDLTMNATTEVDELWAFHMGEGSDLTQVSCGTGTPAIGTIHNRLFLDSPTVGSGGVPNLFVGTNADRTDAFHPPYPAVKSWGRHQFAPPLMAMFVVTTGATYPSVTLRHRPAWFTHAGQ